MKKKGGVGFLALGGLENLALSHGGSVHLKVLPFLPLNSCFNSTSVLQFSQPR